MSDCELRNHADGVGVDLTVIVRVFAVALLVAFITPDRRVAVPAEAPDRPSSARAVERTIRLEIEFDQHVADQHGEAVEDFIREAVAHHAVEWRRYRRDSFEIGSIRLREATEERDAVHVLGSFINRTAGAADTLHVLVSGAPLEVYTSGRRATPVGGVAYRGGDAVVVSALPGVTADVVGYYMFHEIGHCWGAQDLPFGGGNSTFGSKSRFTYDIDVGNAEIVESSAGPRPRDVRGQPAAVLRTKRARGRALGLPPHAYARLHDLLLHEPSPANPAYVEKKERLLAEAGADGRRVAELLQQYEIQPGQARQDDELRARIAEHYWRANDALRRHDFESAAVELSSITAATQHAPDIQLLVSAVERKIRRRR